MSQPWPSHIQDRYTHLYFEENHDVFIFRFNEPPHTYMAIERRSPLQMQIIMEAATIVYYCDQRLKHIDVGL